MYGLEIPQYAREYLREWRREDRFLRLRWSQDEYGKYLLERKTRYTSYPVDRPARRDRCIQLAHGYRTVLMFWPNQIREVAATLAHTDIQRLGGASSLARELDEHDRRERERLEREGHAEFEAIASEHYDRLAWSEGRRVSLAG